MVRVAVVSDPDARHRGLGGVEILPPDSGMLFVYPVAAKRSFWMKDCSLPLAAAFLDDGGRILNIVEMRPGRGIPDADLPMYDSKGPARFVLEMEGGWFSGRGLGPGDRVDLAEAIRGIPVR